MVYMARGNRLQNWNYITKHTQALDSLFNQGSKGKVQDDKPILSQATLQASFLILISLINV